MRKHNTKLADFNIHNLRRNTMLNNNLDLKSAPELKTLKCFLKGQVMERVSIDSLDNGVSK